jgi:integrase/recombinase XerD
MKKSTQALPSHLNDYLDWLDVEKGLSSQTQKNYARFLKRFLDWLKLKKLDNVSPHELTPEHIWDYRIYLARGTTSGRSGASLKKSTQNYYLVVLRSLLGYFAERDILALPPEKVKLALEKEDRQIRFLSLEQVERLFAVPDTTSPSGLRDRAIIETLFSTGMRVSELVALDRDQIEPSLKKGTELELGIVGKGGRARTVYFSPRALDWIGQYLKTRDDMNSALFINYRRKNDSSPRLSVRSIEKMIKQAATRAGLPSNTTPHVLRHSFATDLLEQGVDIRVLQEFLGHKSITATQIYAHVTSKKLREVHQKYHSGNRLKR